MKRVWRILCAPFRLVAWLGRRCLNLASKITGVEFAHGEMDGAGYEHYVAQYLYKNGYKKVIQTGKTGDMGVDLVAKNTGFLTLSSVNITPNPSPALPSRKRWLAWQCTAVSVPWWSPTAT